MSWAKVHRWLAIVLVVLLVVWSVTGLLFHLKPGWSRAYDVLSAERRGPLRPGSLVAPSVVGDEVTALALIDTALGPLYRVTSAAGPALYDATTGARRSPLPLADAKTIVLDAISRSAHASEYGEIVAADVRGDRAVIELSGGATVEVGVSDARLSQRGGDTDRIDWLYRIHYLQWTGIKSVDKVLAIGGLALIWAVMIPGLVLFVRRLRRP